MKIGDDGARLVEVHRVRSVLREHFLAGIVCDHEERTDAAACNCSQWRSPQVESPVAAAHCWIDHFIDVLLRSDGVAAASVTPQEPPLGAEA